MMASQRNVRVFLIIGCVLFMGDDSGREVDDSDDGWLLGSE